MTLAVFAQHVAEKKSLPELKWTHDGDDGEYRLKITSTPTPESVRLWVARSDTKDFRNSKWEATEARKSRPSASCSRYYAAANDSPTRSKAQKPVRDGSTSRIEVTYAYSNVFNGVARRRRPTGPARRGGHSASECDGYVFPRQLRSARVNRRLAPIRAIGKPSPGFWL